MLELLEKYTDDEILKYYSLLTSEERKIRLMLHDIVQKRKKLQKIGK